MKFSISFKYNNVTFKNKETKETISYDTKAEGNTFTFDNVDEDVVLGIVKGIKDRKASQVFSYDDFRTNFINVMARNKCKELYDKLDKGGWKVEDIAISNITIKDLEFTKPTMNAREALTVESRKMRESSEFKPGDLVDWFVPDDDDRYGKDFEGEVFHGGEVYKKQGDVYEVSFGEEGLFYPQGKDLEYHSENLEESKMKRKMNESKYGKGPWPTWVVKERLVQLINGVSKEHPMWVDLVDILEKYYGSMDVEKLVGASKKVLESSESTGDATIEPVIFKKDRRDGEIIAFFPETMFDGTVNRGNIMCYAHNGQSSEASIEYFQGCRPCKDEAEYADLLAELEDYFMQDPDSGNIKLKVVRKPSYGRGPTRRKMWPMLESVNDAAYALDDPEYMDDSHTYLLELADGSKKTIDPTKYEGWADVVEFGSEHYPNTVIVSDDEDNAVGLVLSERDHIEIVKVTDPATKEVWEIGADKTPRQWAKDRVWCYDDKFV